MNFIQKFQILACGHGFHWNLMMLRIGPFIKSRSRSQTTSSRCQKFRISGNGCSILANLHTFLQMKPPHEDAANRVRFLLCGFVDCWKRKRRAAIQKTEREEERSHVPHLEWRVVRVCLSKVWHHFCLYPVQIENTRKQIDLFVSSSWPPSYVSNDIPLCTNTMWWLWSWVLSVK